MLSTLPQLMFPLFLPFGAAVIVGAGCYVLVSLADDKVPDFAELVCMPCTLFLLFPPFLLLFLLLLPLSVLGAQSDRAISAERENIGWHLLRVYVSVVVSLVAALLFYWILSRSGLPLFIHDLRTGIACLGGFLVGPIVAPIFIWVWRSSQMRPGMDRHLEPSEGLSGRS